MKIIGRTKEIDLLNSYYQSGKPEFIAVYGRRRIGKTYLVEQLFEDKISFEVTGIIGGTRKDEIKVFYDALVGIGYLGEVPNNWYDAFYALQCMLEKLACNKHIKHKKQRCLIFIDELPCFDTPSSSFVKAFGNFWNGWCNKRSNVMLVVCGSATSWIIKNIVDSHGGLHNRITHEIHLGCFTLHETELFLHYKGIKWDRLSILEIYSVLGGVPYYLDMIQNDESVSLAIDRLFYSNNSPMKEEYGRLMKSLFNNSEPYVKIIELLCKTKSGMTREEIIEKLNYKSGGHLSEYLENLVRCDFVRFYYMRRNNNTKLKRNGGVYQITDPFTTFHNMFMRNPSTDPHFWSTHINTPVINAWFGFAFERICMLHIEEIKQAIGINTISVEYYSWRSSNSEPAAQIDMIIERADRIINICEIKYSKAEYTLTKKEEMNILNRIETFRKETKTRYAVNPILITTYGLRNNNGHATIDKTITMNDLFK